MTAGETGVFLILFISVLELFQSVNFFLYSNAPTKYIYFFLSRIQKKKNVLYTPTKIKLYTRPPYLFKKAIKKVLLFDRTLKRSNRNTFFLLIILRYPRSSGKLRNALLLILDKQAQRVYRFPSLSDNGYGIYNPLADLPEKEYPLSIKYDCLFRRD